MMKIRELKQKIKKIPRNTIKTLELNIKNTKRTYRSTYMIYIKERNACYILTE